MHQWLGNFWGVLFSYPKDYTPICATELAEVARLKPEWEKRHVKPIGLSVDSGTNHAGWAKDIEETQGQALNFPTIADADRTVSDLYGMVRPDADPSVTVRTVFIVDRNKEGPPDAELPAQHQPQLRRSTARRRPAPSAPLARPGHPRHAPRRRGHRAHRHGLPSSPSLRAQRSNLHPGSHLPGDCFARGTQ